MKPIHRAMAGILGVALSTGAPPHPASADDPPTPAQYSVPLVFAVSQPRFWPDGSTHGTHDDTLEIVDIPLGSSADAKKIKKIDVPRVGSASFGGEIDFESSGSIRLSLKRRWGAPGALQVNYPATLALDVSRGQPNPEGVPITIRPQIRPQPGWSVSAAAPAWDYELAGSGAFSAGSDARVCFIDCINTDFFTDFSIPRQNVTVVGLGRTDDGATVEMAGMDTRNVELPYQIPGGFLTGFLGAVDLPRPVVRADVAGDRLVARGVHPRFVSLMFDFDTWLVRLARLAGVAAPPLGAATPRSFDEVKGEYQILNLGSPVSLSETVETVFDPTVRLTLRFAQAFRYEVWEDRLVTVGGRTHRTSVMVSSGRAAEIPVAADQKLVLTVPSSHTAAVRASVAYTSEAVLSHTLTVTTETGVTGLVGKLSLKVPEKTLFSVFGYDVKSPKVSFSAGPAATFNAGAHTAVNRLEDSRTLSFGGGTLPDLILTADTVPEDTSPPVVTVEVSGTQGNDEWYTSDVAVRWDVDDAESPIVETSGCAPIVVAHDTRGTNYECRARSEGGTQGRTVTVRRDATPPQMAIGVPGTVEEGREIHLNATAEEAFGTVSDYAWSWNEDEPEPQTATGRHAAFRHEDGPTLIPVTVSARDEAGNVGRTTRLIEVVNVAPAVRVAAARSTIQEGEAIEISGAFADPGADAWTATIDFDDGQGPQPLALREDRSFTASHTATSDGPRTITARVEDSDGGVGTAVVTVAVANAVPRVSLPEAAAAAEGAAFSTAGSFADHGSETWRATVDYGDGSGPQPLALQADKTFELSHTYADDGRYVVTVAVVDEAGGNGAASVRVDVSNAAPVIAPITPPTLDEGATWVAEGRFSDPGADEWRGTVDYGDGGRQPLAVTPDKGFTFSHRYRDSGRYAVVLRIDDGDSGVGELRFDVVVRNLAPAVQATLPAEADEGASVAVAGSFTDPGRDTWTATVDYGDGTGPQPVPLDGRTFALHHAFADDGAYDVVVTVADDDGGEGSWRGTLTVRNVAPRAEVPVAGHRAREGEAVALSVTFRDPGTADGHRVTWELGDGTSLTDELAPGASVSTVQQRFADDGTYAVSVTVTDDDGAAHTVGLPLDVANVAPRFEPPSREPLPERQAFSLELRADDVSGDSVSVAVSGLPAGSRFAPVSGAGQGGGTLTWTPACDQKGLYPLELTARDDDGGETRQKITLDVRDACGALVAVADEDGGAVSMIDPLARRVVATIETGRRANAAAFFEPGFGEPAAPVLYVARDGRDGGTLLALTGAAAPPSLEEAARLAPSAALDAGDDPGHVALPPDGTEVWTVNARDGRVSVFDRLTNARRGAFELPRDIVDRPSSLVFSGDGRFAYVVGSRSTSLVILDRQRSETPSPAWIAGTVPLGERPAAIVSIVADTERARLYVGRDRDIVVLTVEDPQQPTIIGTVRLGSDVAGLALLEGGTTLYATLPRQDRVEVLRVSAAGQGGVSLESLGSVVVGRHPTGLAVTRPGSTRQAPILVVANSRSSTVSLIDTATHAVVATLPVHGAPAAVAPAVVPIAVR